MGNVLALDIGGTKIAAAIVAQDGTLSERQQIATPHGDAAGLAGALEKLITPWRNRVDLIAVASTGIISQGRLTALNPRNLGGLSGFPLQDCLRAVADLPNVVLNDGQAAAWAEYQAVQETCDNALFVTVSTGVGGGIIWNRKLLTGRNGLAGHIGHTAFDPQGGLCGCGRRGCVESVASGTAIGHAMMENARPLGAEQVFERARAGNGDAQRVISRSAAAVASMLADMHISLDLDVVMMGGSVGLAEGYREKVAHALNQLPAIYRVALRSAHHRQDSGLIGAALWARATL
ncbi:N-acetylmannosamine kinase [Rahnella sp. BCC 1045]|uniref:N-acetylmannosamine kinase n=1 Tax=Rahnella sp. BCC 1045 TaxID=2816251 RepID=UPI001C257204|nr:N-acetylmannosamine kinase [Rahnella sp. BCC 1045]MBU9819612.1 N-acetylmannosamine kinase [Rahnella sp. BCC 1045]